jgi:hypothetical protein
MEATAEAPEPGSTKQVQLPATAPSGRAALRHLHTEDTEQLLSDDGDDESLASDGSPPLSHPSSRSSAGGGGGDGCVAALTRNPNAWLLLAVGPNLCFVATTILSQQLAGPYFGSTCLPVDWSIMGPNVIACVRCVGARAERRRSLALVVVGSGAGRARARDRCGRVPAQPVQKRKKRAVFEGWDRVLPFPLVPRRPPSPRRRLTRTRDVARRLSPRPRPRRPAA